MSEIITDTQYMNRCINLALNGLGNVAPNPLVGAVIVHEGRVIGEGYHQQYGSAHAEVNAVNSLQEMDKKYLPDSTLYVNLEPCSHHGKTPPCADLIIKEKIRRVVIGSADPNPLVACKGVAKLKAAGIEVTEGIARQDCDELNRRFITFHTLHRPYIILKWAESSNGYFAPNDGARLWLSGEETQYATHLQRSREQAILIGTRTALIDNPLLTTRLVQGRNPTRLLIDLELKVPSHYQIFNTDAPTIVYTYRSEEISSNVTYVMVDGHKDLLTQILADLYLRHIQSVIIEGGAYTLQKWIDADLWDEAHQYISPQLLARGIKGPTINETKKSEIMVGADRCMLWRRLRITPHHQR